MKLSWKHKWLDDKSGSWYTAKVPVLGWEYIVEDNAHGSWDIGLFLNKIDAEVTRISKKSYKTKKDAMIVCEKHIQVTAEKFVKWANTK